MTDQDAMEQTTVMHTGADGTDPAAYFVPVGPDAYLPTEHVGGAWSDDELQSALAGALLVHHLERGGPSTPTRTS